MSDVILPLKELFEQLQAARNVAEATGVNGNAPEWQAYTALEHEFTLRTGTTFDYHDKEHGLQFTKRYAHHTVRFNASDINRAKDAWEEHVGKSHSMLASATVANAGGYVGLNTFKGKGGPATPTR